MKRVEDWFSSFMFVDLEVWRFHSLRSGIQEEKVIRIKRWRYGGREGDDTTVLGLSVGHSGVW